MKSLKGTQTEKNLLHSFAGESQARMRYNYFASKAKKDGFVQIADIFEETANQEKEHAKRFFKFLEGGCVEITDKEGFPEIAEVFRNVAIAEKQHEKRYRGLLANIENGTVFEKDGKVWWRCRNCGYICEAEKAPIECPACAHAQAHFELLAENW